MTDSLTTKFENALIELIEQYVNDGLTNTDIRGVLDARRDDDHEYRDAPTATFELPKPTPDQEAYLRRIQEQTGKYDPTVMVGGPNKPPYSR